MIVYWSRSVGRLILRSELQQMMRCIYLENTFLKMFIQTPGPSIILLFIVALTCVVLVLSLNLENLFAAQTGLRCISHNYTCSIVLETIKIYKHGLNFDNEF